MKRYILSGGRLAGAVARISRISGVFVALPLLAMLGIGSGTAKAVVLQENSGSFLCANVKGAVIANGTAVIAFACTGDFNEQWDYVDGEFLGLGTTSGVNKCLDVKGNGTKPGTLVDLYSCNGGQNQQWSVFNGTTLGLPSSGLIYNPQSGLCLDSSGGSGAQLTIEICNGAASQNWKVE